jgi:predicted DNA-binding WGR domain protein
MPRFESRSGRFLELEIEDAAVTHVEGTVDGAHVGKSHTRTFSTADEARHAAARLIARRRKHHGYQLVGQARHLGGGGGERVPPASVIALEAYFTAADPQFLTELLRPTSASHAAGIAGLAERWYRDDRPWARDLLRAYIADGCDRPWHKALVKRLFKLAEAAGDDELMAHFMVAFDRLSRRYLIKESKYAGWDRAAQRAIVLESMRLVQDPSIPARLPKGGQTGPAVRGKAGARRKPARTRPADEPQFTRVTRRYLARRAYRYFRMLGHRDPARYGRAMRLALPRYTDESLSAVSRLLDAWGLMHALYARSPVIVRSPGGIRLAEDKRIADLAPAPHFDAAWDGVFTDLLALAGDAGSRTVRAWAVALLRARYDGDLAALAFPAIKRLVMSPHDEVVALGIERLTRMPGLETIALHDWLDLLAVGNLDVLPVIAELAERSLSPARLGLGQCIDLACSKTAPVARLGLGWAKTKTIETADDLRSIARLTRAGVAAVRDEGTAWAVALIAAHPATRPDELRDLCDGPHADARARALAVVAGDERFAAVPALWLALAESPYPDVRTVVVRHVARWRDQADAATLRHVWATALLSIHGGSRVKAQVPRQIADRIAAHPDEAAALLPVLGHALRSVRPAERALALGALARAARARPALAQLAHQVLPELTLSAQVSS